MSRPRDETDHLHSLQHHGMQLPPSRDYSTVRRPDVLVGGPHGLAPEQTDLMLHHTAGLHGMDETAVSVCTIITLMQISYK